MKTRKQVLAEFQQIQNSLPENMNGIVSVNTYYMGGEFWEISMSVTEYVGNIIVRKEYVRWVHFTEHRDKFENDNEEELKNFKLKFNLK